MAHIVYLSLGSNLGDKEENLNVAIDMIGDEVGTVLKVSSYIPTEPWGFESDNSFVNCALSLSTELEPMQVLKRTQKIERKMGRTKKSHDGLYDDRIIDIDILTYDDITMDTPELTLPHPLMYERDFVMVPLNEILD